MSHLFDGIAREILDLKRGMRGESFLNRTMNGSEFIEIENDMMITEQFGRGRILLGANGSS